MAKFRSGKTSRAIVASQTLAVGEWSTDYNGAKLETTNFESNGKFTGLTGILSVSWSISGHWDAGANPLDDPPGLYPRDDGSNMQLFTKVADNVFWSFPTFLVETSTVKSTFDGLVEFDTSGSSNGDFAPPTGSV